MGKHWWVIALLLTAIVMAAMIVASRRRAVTSMIGGDEDPEQDEQPEHDKHVVLPPPAQPALTPLMQRVKEARDNVTAEGVAIRRRWRHCFHEAAHAFVGHGTGEKVSLIEIDVPPNQRPKATMTMLNLAAMGQAVSDHGRGSNAAAIPARRFFAYMAAGELAEREVESTHDPISVRLDRENWWNREIRKVNTDIERIVVEARVAGLKDCTRLVQEGEAQATQIIAERRTAFEALVTRLYDGGNIADPELERFVEA